MPRSITERQLQYLDFFLTAISQANWSSSKTTHTVLEIYRTLYSRLGNFFLNPCNHNRALCKSLSSSLLSNWTQWNVQLKINESKTNLGNFEVVRARDWMGMATCTILDRSGDEWPSFLRNLLTANRGSEMSVKQSHNAGRYYRSSLTRNPAQNGQHSSFYSTLALTHYDSYTK